MIIIYLGKENAKILKGIENEKVVYKRIGDADLGRSLEECFHKQNSAKGRKKHAYICAQTQQEAFSLMRTLKSKGYMEVRISILTEMNKDWTVEKWMEELDQEFLYFSLREKLSREIQIFQKKNNKTLESLLTLEKAKKVYNNAQATTQDFEQAIQEFHK